jgi:hypothetical protein
MDPLAWQLAFGMTAVFTAIHMLYLVFEFIDYFTVWLLFVVCLTVGLFYGGVTYFLEIYTVRRRLCCCQVPPRVLVLFLSVSQTGRLARSEGRSHVDRPSFHV